MISEILTEYATVTPIITFGLGIIFGHRLSVSRDDRNRRIAAFQAIAATVRNSTHGPLPQADVDKILSMVGRFRRNSMVNAINNYKIASQSYFDQKDAWGTPSASINSQSRMDLAKHNLVKVLLQ